MTFDMTDSTFNIVISVLQNIVVAIIAVALTQRYERRFARLRPGRCECGHMRCAHVEGRKNCTSAALRPDRVCACEVFIPRAEDEARDAEVTELRKMAGLK